VHRREHRKRRVREIDKCGIACQFFEADDQPALAPSTVLVNKRVALGVTE
jgi:hypothetical protein